MSIDFKLAKKYAADKMIKQALKYLEKDPDENFLQILNIGEKLVRRDNHKKAIKIIKENYKTTPLIKKYLKKINNIAPSYKNGFLMNFLVNSAIFGIPYQYELSEELGVDVPWAILIDPTSACNLNCEGCWAGKYNKSDSLDFATIDRIITEAKEMGIYFIVLSGGEPTVYPQLFDILEKHDDVGFMMYTNGTLIDDEFADRMLEVGNVTPAISLEGFREETDKRRGEGTYDKIMDAMDRLRERGIIFGASVTATKNNVDELFSDEFIDHLSKKGALYMWLFHYIPIGRNPNLDMMITPEQRVYLARRGSELRKKKEIFIMDFWNDGTYVQGCIAGGRRYFHINAKGEVEPCAFVHFAVDNIKEKSLKEALQNPLFKSFQKKQPFTNNLMCPCPIIDNPKALRDIVEESGAVPTHDGADEILKDETADFLDDLSAKWHKSSKDINKERMNNK
ncbi:MULTISPECIES: radical SAM protein [unclassified Halanaerobium]|uniref:radical SAM protein n=1 Tax=unclassified Halanaerobium TaxID=2641197 RepID=UPI000DF2195F|nr:MULTISPECIES: radical SAM protein [unclassified Halanaerobium]RCW50783.1 radical SAM protein with 4Fe4S-binding SPASM domain [Halanaerobium sp. MA284_MarDTE_T2]RCW84961.1 radical SAM protein with 4Fe4S-binding SPASM domain [Halanaerobium sp. DL-01]